MATCSGSKLRAATCGWCIRRSIASKWPAPTPPGAWCSSPSDSKPRLPPTPCPYGRRAPKGRSTSDLYSPLDCLKVARANPSRRVVFFAIGFETTAPANAMSVWQARAEGLVNYSVLVSHVTVPPAMTAILESPGNRVRAFLGAGHVCAVMGWEEYEPLAARYRVPIVVTGFEPLDLLEGILMAVRQLESGRHEVENQYARAVVREGNPEARRMIARVFEPCDRAWRGIGVIPGSGYRLREGFAGFDAARVL